MSSVGVVTVVIPSLLLAPVSLVGSSTGGAGAAGGAVSIVTESAADAEVVVPSRPTWSAVMAWAPSVNVVLPSVVIVVVLAVAMVDPIRTPSENRLTTAPGS